MMSTDPTVLFGANAGFVEALYEEYLADPTSVDPEWRQYFDALRGRNGAHEVAHSPVQQAFIQLARHRRGAAPVQAAPEAAAFPGVMGARALINAYRQLGHLAAHTNPLADGATVRLPELEPQYYGLTEADLAVNVSDGVFAGPLRQVIAELQQTYCATIGYEYSYLPRAEREWLQERIEKVRGRKPYDAAAKRRLFEKLNAAEGLEKYLHTRYVGQKRFSLEGGESLIPMMDWCIQRAGSMGVREVVIGMAHRGRLNVLINTFGKKPSDLFLEFEGKKQLAPGLSGDVKYHMGFSSDVPSPGGPVHLVLAFNPSHLELVDPVVEGSARAREDHLNDTRREQVLPILIHGDAALPGQGIVAETLNLSQTRGYATGGTLHIVVNNQVGFTASAPEDLRSGHYTTDIAKFADSPVFHVNGDDPEAVAWVIELALEYQHHFHKDCFIDMVCFRRHGHNESDEPRVTQPVLYRAVDKHPGTRTLYAQQLEKEGVLAAGEEKQLWESYRDALDAGESVVEQVPTAIPAEHFRRWEPYYGSSWTTPADTTYPLDKLKALGDRLVELPEGFKLHPRVEAIIKARKAMYEGEHPLDWGAAENLAYATLLSRGYAVRISGEDVGRGTFFHRHAVWHNQVGGTSSEGDLYIPLQHIAPHQPRFEVWDSVLSEEAVLGFEYGYACTNPNTLVLWEAQYGDFANVAQAVIDQFISAGEAKWSRLCGLTMMLPHGYEGQGPEHSSARLERYLQLCAEENMQVVVPSTPAQMYHALRRQMVRPYRKPLVIMSPKSLLRHKSSVSSLEDLANGTFQLVIGEEAQKGVDRVVLCSGKLYYELIEARHKQEISNVAIVRVEQLYPFPVGQLREELSKYPHAAVVWAQEEPHNQGAWLLIQDDLRACLGEGQTLTSSTRPRAAAPATGLHSKHVEQQQALINKALGLRTSLTERALTSDQMTG